MKSLDTILYEDGPLTVGELEILEGAVDIYENDTFWLECIERRIERSLKKLRCRRLRLIK